MFSEENRVQSIPSGCAEDMTWLAKHSPVELVPRQCRVVVSEPILAWWTRTLLKQVSQLSYSTGKASPNLGLEIPLHPCKLADTQLPHFYVIAEIRLPKC